MATPAPDPQPTIETVGSDSERPVNVVETPTSPSSAFTLSRFEFETGTKGNEGTKILMVEWDVAAAKNVGKQEGEEKKEGEGAVAVEKANIDDWEVKWEGKEALLVLPIRDTDAPETTCRIYFLLPPKAPIPTLVTISPISSSESGGQDSAAAATVAQRDLHTKPLPAIFPEGLQVLEEKGTRGVLHTIWAKKRLEQLEAEIVAEMKKNGESVGLEMAYQEKQWIVDHFGLQIDTSSAEAIPLPPQGSNTATSPTSPRSPIGGRLGEKLKGLKLATSPAGLAAAKEAAKSSAAPRQVVAVAPDASGFQPRPMATGSAAAPGTGAMASLSAVIQGGGSAIPGDKDATTEEDLFALPMSPRSPEMAMSPFSLLKS